MELAGVEDSDDDDRTDVVDDGRRGQEDAQLHRDARARSSRSSAIANAVSVAIGTPQPCAHGPAGMTSAYISRRHDHAAERGRDRQRGGAPVGKVADGELALDLEPDDAGRRSSAGRR